MAAKILLLLALAVLAAGCVSAPQSPATQVIVSTPAGQEIVDAELADEPAEWAKGLMNRTSLAEGHGMLFVFPDERRRSFWMKDTLIPLDIIFVSGSFEIVDIATLQPCAADPCPAYASKSPARYVLEVNAGFAEANSITIGERIAISIRR